MKTTATSPSSGMRRPAVTASYWLQLVLLIGMLRQPPPPGTKRKRDRSEVKKSMVSRLTTFLLSPPLLMNPSLSVHVLPFG